MNVLLFRAPNREGAVVASDEPIRQAARIAWAMAPDFLASTEWVCTQAEVPRDAVWPEQWESA